MVTKPLNFFMERSKNICFDTDSARNNTSVILSPQFIYLWGLFFYFLLLSFYFLKNLAISGLYMTKLRAAVPNQI